VCYLRLFFFRVGNSFSHTQTSFSVFFEKLRILEGREKSEGRLRNESLFPYGISTKKPDAQIGSHDLFQEEADPCEDSDEMDEEDSETDLQCYDHFA